MRVHLIRHGETDWNVQRRIQGHAESRLTERGQEQARALATLLADHPITTVYCSTSLRARQTADLVFAGRHLERHLQDALREIDLSPWEGRLYADLERTDTERFQNFWGAPQLFMLPGAETFADLQERAWSALQNIRAQASATEVAIVSHGAWLATLLTRIEQRPLAEVWQAHTLPNCAHRILQWQDPVGWRIITHA